MKVFEVIYSMGGIAIGGFFKSIVVTHDSRNIKGLLNEVHEEEVLDLYVEESEYTSDCKHEQVLTTINV